MPRFRAHVAVVLFVVSLCAAGFHAASADPRPPETLDAAQIRLALDKLGVVGTVLYVGAHPDDENTALLAWLANGKQVRTIYLSLTRGDGGQNLMGFDTGERLGVIRTQELLAARRLDGAEQRFTRALDFGFSKNSDESLRLWGHDRILADVVWTIRSLEPDVIITRFPPDSTAGHGHHAASAILAAQAFRAAGDSTAFPEQLADVRPWRAKRLLWNVSRILGPDTTPRDTVDVGAYNSLLGLSYSELAGRSRSMHKTQGFGAPERRGAFVNTFILRSGAPAARDLFEGVDLSWSRVAGGGRVQPLVEQARREFDPDHPEKLLPVLMRLHAALVALPDEPIVEKKRTELDALIRSCAGLWLEAIASAPLVSPGARVRVATSALARTGAALTLERVELVGGADGRVLQAGGGARELPVNAAVADTFRTVVPDDAGSAQPYWLRRPEGAAWFEPDGGARLAGLPENPAALSARFHLVSSGERFTLDAPVVYRWVDPVAGERYRALDVVPPASVHFERGVALFAGAAARPVDVRVRAADVPVAGDVVLDLPQGWHAAPARVRVVLAAGGDTLVRFAVTPAAGPAAAPLHAALVTAAGARYDRDRVTLDYPHVPVQTLLPAAEARAVRADLRVTGREVGYVMGPGDQVPEALAQMGLGVTMLDDEAIEHGDLARFPVIVIGVRAYNTRPRLLAHQGRLLDWVANGGRLVVQYQTPDNALDAIGPEPFHISRDRVTVEDAPVKLLAPTHPLLNAPNRIGAADFAGWVQERGLWFANPWDPAYTALLSCTDPGEPPHDGGLIVTKHGKGTFVYTGYAFFRQLPAGVPGAWRLFANLVSAGK